MNTNTLHSKILFAVGIPYTKDAFFQIVESGQSDFIKSITGDKQEGTIDQLWEKYEKSIKPFIALLSKAQDLGADVNYVSDSSQLHYGNEYHAIVLIAHHSDVSDDIELLGHMTPVNAIIDAFDPDYNGIFDLASCYSTSLHQKLKLHCPKARIISAQGKVNLHARAVLLSALLSNMCKTGNSYEEAFRQAIDEVQQRFSPQSSKTDKRLTIAKGGRFTAPSLERTNQCTKPAEKVIFPSECTIATPKEEKVNSFFSKLRGLFRRSKTPAVHLGGETCSTVFAPQEVRRGTTFLVQLFLHKQSESEEIEITAKMVDTTAEKRNSKKLNIVLKKGAKVNVQLVDMTQNSQDFQIDKTRKSLVWNNEPSSVEFCVTVSKQTTAQAFIGKLQIYSNKRPLGECLFKTEIKQENPAENHVANIEFVPYRQAEEMNTYAKKLIDSLEKQKRDITARIEKGDFEGAKRDLEVCEKCISLVNERSHAISEQIRRVFISSTSELQAYREVVRKQVESCSMFPEMYENWSQSNAYPRDMCCERVLGADVLICILGARYGYVEPCWDMSMTEIEYRVAIQAGIPVLVYILDNHGTEETTDKRQHEFINEVKNVRLVEFFSDELKLALQTRTDLLTLLNENYATR